MWEQLRSKWVAGLLAVALMVLGVHVASAAASWCEEDPIIHFADGSKVNVAIAVPSDRVHQVHKAVVRLIVPAGAPIYRVETTNLGFFHEEVVLEYDYERFWDLKNKNTIVAEITVIAADSFPVQATAWGSHTVKPKLTLGLSNTKVKIKQVLLRAE